MRTHLALIRGINVGGNNLIRMADLRSLMEEVGLREGATLLQSGNLVFDAHELTPSEIEVRLREECRSRFGVDPEFYVRSKAEWNAIVAENPFPEFAQADPGHLVVHVGTNIPEVDLVVSGYEGPEVLAKTDRAFYVCFPNGIGESKLMTTKGWKANAARLTGRNWNTVLKLQALFAEVGQ